MKVLLNNFKFLLVLFFLLVILEAVELDSVWAQLALPKPMGIFHAVYTTLVSDGSFYYDFGITLIRILSGLFLGTLFAVPLGIIIGLFGRNLRELKYIVDFVRSIPQIALFPLFALLFGIDDFGKIMMATTASFLVILVATIDGVIFGVQERQDTMVWLSASKKDYFFHLTLPQSLPSITVGIRIASSITIIVVLISEMLYGTLDGIGYRLYLSQLSYNVDAMWGYILLTGCIGLAINTALTKLQKKFIHWEQIKVES